MKPVAVACGFSLFLGSNLFAAYEPGTHVVVSNSAALASVLVQKSAGTNTDVLDDLGLKGYLDSHQQFLDGQVGESIYLDPDKQHLLKAASSGDVQYLIQAGAALEDEGFRAFCHFYDPLPGHTAPLSALGFVANYSAPEWATGNSDSGALANDGCQFGPVGSFPQLYSLKNAEDYFYRALTLPSESDRNQQFGNLFLSLGHAMHLLQDTSVPQHVRDDMHCDDPLCKFIFLYHPSKYEAYTYYSAPIGPSTYGSVIFPDGDARSFWSNDIGSGIAQFTNLNFLSVGTMSAFGAYDSSAKYSLPVWNGAASVESVYDVYQGLNQPVPQQVADACPQESASTPCDVTFLASTGTDQYIGSPITNPEAATLSLFDEDLRAKGDTEVFALNRVNYQAAWNFLIPRAVAYSTGLVNYFFRGRLDVQPDPNNPGGYLVINKSSYPMSNGTLTLYYDTADGTRVQVPNASWSNVSMAAAGNDPADEYSIQFSTPTDPTPATPGQYMLVFQGKIGTEAGIAGKLFGVVPHYLYTFTHQLCGSNLDCVTVSAFTDDFNFGSLHTIDTQVSSGGGFYPIIMAIYNGIDYVIDFQFELYPPSSGFPPGWGCGGTLAKIQDLTILEFPCTGDTVTTLDGIAVNTNYIYVSGTERPDYVGNIFVFDHSGNSVKTLVNMPAAGLTTLSANDSRLCLSGWVDSGLVSGTVLTDLNGSVIATWPGDPDFGGGPCILTKDRVYVLAWADLGDATLNVYDLNGDQISSQVIAGSMYALDVSATDSRVYVSSSCANDDSSSCSGAGVIIVYDRVITYNPDGTIKTEQLVRQPSVSVPWAGPWTSYSIFWGVDVTADMRDVLHGSENH